MIAGLESAIPTVYRLLSSSLCLLPTFEAMNESPVRPSRGWAAKFRDAMRGMWIAARASSSHAVHALVAAAVVAAGVALRVERLEWCLLGGCIALVLAAETFNSALESLAKALTDQYHPKLRDALDMGSGAVLVTAIGAVVIGVIVFLPRLIALFER